ncbi:conserved hypothetical protein [Xenorhabdus cabanillasii JM26]|uniref:SRPBCC family protein n=2 Tax=Xenorhabdus cabanillasii TaxID=351673 RepID=W1INU4_9GAMM|nr:hypothetical protein Xcab_03846 [Xenorhabdus cabanillasii JM26]CDL79301.1 conserved hypothetical protein [Xenorhabdus cabanillasii JM26]
MISMSTIVSNEARTSNVSSIHMRIVDCTPTQLGALLARFDEPHSPCWPYQKWPRDDFDGPIQVGTEGGHGATRYRVEQYQPDKGVLFRFISPDGYEGVHGFLIYPYMQEKTLLIHFTHLYLRRSHYLIWHCCTRWVHDALICDLLDGVELCLTGVVVHPRRWKWRVYFIRHVLGGVRLLFGKFKSRSKKNECL